MTHGYSAMGSGKIYHGPFPDPASWNEYWPSQAKNKPNDPMPPRKERPLNGIPGTGHFDWGPLKVPPNEMGDWKVADWVIKRLNTKHDKPFFLGCGFFRPHLPWYVPRKYFDLYPLDTITLPDVNENDLDDIPPAGKKFAKPNKDHAKVLKYNQWRKAVQAYLASISFVDECVGRVINALDKSPYRDNTIIVLWSDHGWHLGEKLHWRKFALWEEATHNVLMFSVPGITKPGQKCTTPVNLIDIYPTLVDICGLIKRPELEGVSLLPLLKDPSTPWDRPALTTYGRNNHSLRSPRWRYIRYADGSEELYDHTKDPLEWKNLASDKKYTKIKKELKQHLPRTNARFSFTKSAKEESPEEIIDE
jgi:arylsulfatase A-like enzyme